MASSPGRTYSIRSPRSRPSIVTPHRSPSGLRRAEAVDVWGSERLYCAARRDREHRYRPWLFENRVALVERDSASRTALVAERQQAAERLANLRVQQASFEAHRARITAEGGPALYLAKLFGSDATEAMIRPITAPTSTKKRTEACGRRSLRETRQCSKRLIAESRRIGAALLLESMFRSDALVCASKIEQRGRKLGEMNRRVASQSDRLSALSRQGAAVWPGVDSRDQARGFSPDGAP